MLNKQKKIRKLTESTDFIIYEALKNYPKTSFIFFPISAGESTT